MKLLKEESELFYKLMNSFLLFVNQKFKINSNVKTLEDIEKLIPMGKVQIRDAVYENKDIFDQYISANPHKLSNEELEIVKKWKFFVEGEFYIFKFLKKYAVFIKGENVYGVHGITQSFDEMIHPSNLPLLVGAVLLPFKDKIVYDGVFTPYSLTFGSGIKGELNEFYLRSKQNNRIIENLNLAENISFNNTLKSYNKSLDLEIKKIDEQVKKLEKKYELSPLEASTIKVLKANLNLCGILFGSKPKYSKIYDALDNLDKELGKTHITFNRDETPYI